MYKLNRRQYKISIKCILLLTCLSAPRETTCSHAQQQVSLYVWYRKFSHNIDKHSRLKRPPTYTLSRTLYPPYQRDRKRKRTTSVTALTELCCTYPLDMSNNSYVVILRWNNWRDPEIDSSF